MEKTWLDGESFYSFEASVEKGDGRRCIGIDDICRIAVDSGSLQDAAVPAVGTLIGILIGSLVGSVFAVIHNIHKECLISFCVETGFTFFGLVEQNYELPLEVIKDLGIDTVEIPRVGVERVTYEQTRMAIDNIERVQFETVELLMVRRGVIGVNKIGYILC